MQPGNPANDSFRDTIGTVDEDGKRVWIFPKKPAGFFYKYRTYLSYFLLALLFSGPFLRFNGHPLMLFNVLERKFIVFGLAFWPQDFKIFVIGVIAFIIFIVLFTVVFGRLFCGWVCPQTIFMEMVFRKIEYWIDGDAGAQKALAKAPWNAAKIRKRTIKFAIFFFISFLIANTFLAYIIGSDALFQIIFDNPFNHLAGLSSILIFTGVFFFVYWWFREQACLIVCPYGRLQGVLLDKNSINVSYDFERGEPRGNPKKAKSTQAPLGDCIDCNMCVKVCPTGIDIRNGTQLECVNCTACIDACDEVMDKVAKPKGLIRYASYNQIIGKEKSILNTRVLAYSAILVLLVSLFAFLMIARSDTETTLLRAKGQLYSITEEGNIRNLYTIRSINKSFSSKEVSFRLKEPSNGGNVLLIGSEMKLDAQEQKMGGLFIELNPTQITNSRMKVVIEVVANGKVEQTIKTTFDAPQNNN